ncbi:MAG: acyl-CoA thioesterase [Deltaproteobacteria bacterium]|nr:acyl-CoA thioesterase [Deltaproteobacteria bacterium]
MPRVKNDLKDIYEFSCIIEVRMGDINIGGHVGNSQMIAITHDARIKLFKELGLTELNLGDGKTGTVVADISANFKAEVFLDDNVVVRSQIGEILKSGFRLFQCVECNGKTAALIETGIVAFDFEERKGTALPEVFKKRLQDYLNR